MKKLDNIFTQQGAGYYHIENADGKYWILPKKHISTAIELYQPSGRNGRLLKALLPLLHNIPAVRKILNINTHNLSLNTEIKAIARGAFGIADPEFSIFGGTPSVHQKITIQFFAGNKILGYGKITDSDSIAALFSHEQQLLDTLRSAGITDIPECLYCGQLSTREYLFLQSTCKTRKSFSPSGFTTLHKLFLSQLYEATQREILFDDTDFAHSLVTLKENLEIIPEEFKETIGKALYHVIGRLGGTTVNYSAYHADFTPWNMFITGQRLFVFDWEYGRLTYPPQLDRYHFIAQQAFHVDHLTPSDTLRRLKESDDFSADELRYYLLDIISRYTHRENGHISPALYSSLEFWSQLLTLI